MFLKNKKDGFFWDRTKIKIGMGDPFLIPTLPYGGLE